MFDFSSFDDNATVISTRSIAHFYNFLIMRLTLVIIMASQLGCLYGWNLSKEEVRKVERGIT